MDSALGPVLPAEVQRQAPLRGPGPARPGGAPAFIFGASCTPYASRLQAEAAWAYVVNTYIPFATGVFGSDTAALWLQYLDRASSAVPRPHQTLSARTSIRVGFTAHHRTAEAEEGLIAEVIRVVNSGAIAVTPGTPRRMTLADAIGAGTVFTVLNAGGTREMSFDQPATTIPGNLAGGVGSGGAPGGRAADPDTRNAWGEVEILVTAGTGGGAGTVTVTPFLNFHVHDTVDFCPGALGGAAAQVETIPMSRLEATGAAFGTVYAADVPFDLDYPGPGTPRTAPFTPAPPPLPPPPPVVLPTKILFEYNSAAVSAAGSAALTSLLPRLRRSPSTDVIGHTDDRGSDAYNEGLSRRRAAAVVAELIRQDPSLAGRLHPSGRGEREPVSSNATAAGRAENRRVELVFGP